MSYTLRLYGSLVLSFFAPALIHAQAPTISIVSAANYQPAVAPGSLGTIFGSNLARQSLPATLDDNGQLPTELDGTSVEVAGVAAPLIYVSPRQINFVVPSDTPSGSIDIVVHGAAGTTSSGTVQVNDTAPALFSLDASGAGAGAILNAVTYAPAPFLVATDENGGTDKRTRLALYATGIRYAGNANRDPSISNVADNVTAQARDATGASYDLAVEYAGPAAGYFGLDQVNVVLPAGLDMAGTVSLFLNTPDASSNTVTIKMNALTASAIGVAGISVTPSYVSAGDSVTGKVSLNGRAPTGGASVSLRSSALSAQAPAAVVVPAGSVSAMFNITTSFAATTQTATITAQLNGASQSATLEVDPANSLTLQNLTVDASAVQGGDDVTATLTLSGIATGGGGVSVPITSDNPAVVVPAAITVPFGRQSASVTIPTTVVTTTQMATISTVYGHVTKQATVSVNPALALSLSSNSVTGGSSVQATVKLSETQPGTVSITLQSSDPSAIPTPATAIITPGQSSVSFTLNTVRVSATRNVAITASSPSFAGVKPTATLAVLAPASATLQSVTVAPARVTGGQAASGTLTLGAPAPIGGVTVVLRSSSAAAQLTNSVVLIPQGQSTGSFQISTTPVAAAQIVTITATAAGVSKTATLTVQ